MTLANEFKVAVSIRALSDALLVGDHNQCPRNASITLLHSKAVNKTVRNRIVLSESVQPMVVDIPNCPSQDISIPIESLQAAELVHQDEESSPEY